MLEKLIQSPLSILDMNVQVFYISTAIQALALFMFFVFGLSISNATSRWNWFRALCLSIFLTLLSLLPYYIGPLGWFVSIILAIFLISWILEQGKFTALLTLVLVVIVQQVAKFFIYFLS